eukprot:Hpha_TRINITY_DN12411_c0_g2::TRINITY_DN12411_c0_g2_i1::g.42686::m.42686
MGILSIRNLTLTLAIVLIMISGGITGYMSIITGEQALDGTRSMYERGLKDTQLASAEGLDACFDAGIQNSKALAGQLMGKVTDEIAARIDGFLSKPLALVESLRRWEEHQPPCYGPNHEYLDCGHKDDEWVKEIQLPMMYAMFREAAEYGVTEFFMMQLPQYNNTISLFVETPFTMTAENGKRFDLPDDYKQLMLIYYPKDLCNQTLTEAECKNYPHPLPDWMTEENWKLADNCNWCVRDHTEDNSIPLAANQEFFAREGYCSWNAKCDWGYKQDPTHGYKDGWRPIMTAALVNDRGQPLVAPCPDLVDSAKRRGAGGGACAVKAELLVMDFVLTHSLGNEEHLKKKRTMWGPLTTRGPNVGLPVFHAYWDEDAWEDKIFKKAGRYISSSIDVQKASVLMKDIIKPLQPGTILYGVQQNPFFLEGGPAYTCKDDPYSMAYVAQVPCSLLVMIFGCEFDMYKVPNDAGIPRFTYVHMVCPMSCKRCPEDTDDAVGKEVGQGALPGSSHGKSYTNLDLAESSYGEKGMVDRFPVNIWDSEDPVVRSHGRYVLNLNSTEGEIGYNALPLEGVSEYLYRPSDSGANISLTGGIKQQWMPPGEGEPTLYWVKVTLLKNVEQGLRLHMVLLIPRDEAMKTIDAATTQTRAEVELKAARVRRGIEAESAEVDDKKEEDFWTMIIVVVACCVVLMFVSVCFVLSITRPLLNLEYEMSEVARMHLEAIDTDRKPHTPVEVGNMQRSFFVMIRNLIEYRNYMPQSILVGDDDEEEEEDIDRFTLDSDRENTAGAGTGGREGTGAKDSRRNSVRDSMAASGLPGRQQSSQLASRLSGGGLERSRSVLCREILKTGGQFSEGLKKKTISMTVLAFGGWHRLMEVVNDGGTECHNTLLSVALEAFGPGSKGVAETFNGDRLSCSWNAVKACSGHRMKATEATILLKTKMEVAMGEEPIRSQAFGTLSLSIAIVAGDARVGNAGCAGMKKFALMSPVVTWLYALERFSCRHGIHCAADRWIFTETVNSFFYRAFEYVLFQKRAPKAMPVFELQSAKEASEDEWMYQIEEGEKSDPNASWNKFFDAAVGGNLSLAQDLLPGAISKTGDGGRIASEILAGVDVTPATIEYH